MEAITKYEMMEIQQIKRISQNIYYVKPKLLINS